SASERGLYATPLAGGAVLRVPFFGQVRPVVSAGISLGRSGPGKAPELTDQQLWDLANDVRSELARLGMSSGLPADRKGVLEARRELEPELWRRPLRYQGEAIAQMWSGGEPVRTLGAGHSVEGEWFYPIFLGEDADFVKLSGEELAYGPGGRVILE